MKLVLSTSNLMGGGPSIIRRPSVEKSNTELITALRANFLVSQQAAASSTSNGASTTPSKLSYQAWTACEDSTLYIPTLDFAHSGLAEERSQYDITVKLFYLPGVPSSRRCAQTREAIDLVLRELHVPSIDLLIVSFPGFSFDADDEEDDALSEPDGEVDGIPEDGSGSESGVGAEGIDTMIETWRSLEKLHDDGIISRLGVSEFGTARLARFLGKTRIRPSVDQINVRDCCVVPKPLILYAKQEKIELLTHNDCTNILPRGTLRELLGSGEKGVGVLAGPSEEGEGLRGDVEPQWVVKYTAVVKDRGVVENKGYFAVAELRE